MGSRLFYFTSGMFIGINYRDQLTPYTEPVQELVTKKANEIKNTYFPDVELPIPLPKPKSEPKTRYEKVKEYVVGKKED